ncbi:PEP-CTERM sorting domain-containing protein [Rubellicoccus peritrichatus]|uniref:PEP-CTERM sorting domain-containing protein n=1 Tax=Rubellicoccus peritrichatus TaxID=3080537 RepID=A0AAQ3LCT3_9BACT|nr:PEP-CTERM sorting domain-containing protein [Puniceicoccus sp. CR14]WOO43431.1 PEP-CTERM sorting domain-containing protein [Puniceicoccus sp. CR14]
MMNIPNSSMKIGDMLFAPIARKLAFSSYALLFALNAQASFVLIDDFDGYLAGSEVGGQGDWVETNGSDDVFTVVDTGGNHVMAIENSASGRGLINTSSDINITQTSGTDIGTIFFTISFETAAADEAAFDYGLQIAGNTSAGSISTRVTASIADTQSIGELKVVSGGATADLTLLTTYEYWIVADNSNDMQSHYIRELGEVTSPTAIASNVAFTGGAVAQNLTELFFRTQNTGSNVTYIDNLYIDGTGENLASPISIPEPATVALMVGVAVMGYTTYRRRRS